MDENSHGGSRIATIWAVHRKELSYKYTSIIVHRCPRYPRHKNIRKTYTYIYIYITSSSCRSIRRCESNKNRARRCHRRGERSVEIGVAVPTLAFNDSDSAGEAPEGRAPGWRWCRWNLGPKQQRPELKLAGCRWLVT